ncbi:hypothetical protein ACFQZ4_31605 [Catellatospora coxensis]
MGSRVASPPSPASVSSRPAPSSPTPIQSAAPSAYTPTSVPVPSQANAVDHRCAVVCIPYLPVSPT